MRYAVLLASSLLVGSALPAAAQHSVLFQQDMITNTCAGPITQVAGGTLIPGDATWQSCRTYALNWMGVTFMTPADVTVPPAYICFYQYCGPGGINLHCQPKGQHRGKPIALRMTPTPQH
ncbi:MAG: hypothetical protein ABSA90_13445 [Xanthobacteraceae bacterium]